MKGRRSLEDEVVCLARRLSVRGAHLRPAGGDWHRLHGEAGHASGDRVAAVLADELSRRGLIVSAGSGQVLSEAGRALVRRSLAAADPYLAQHAETAVATITDDDGVARQILVNRDESPLSWLRHRRSRDGRPMIDAAEFSAGERLRSDYTRGRLLPRVTANWDATATAPGRGGPKGTTDVTDAAIAARRRVDRALSAVGPELGGLLVDFCCFLKGLEEIERDRRWPARSAKIVLRLALSALARHYGLAARAKGPHRVAMVHWGAEDYRPTIE